MIVATAGHVDHGKTSLVKHLTGVETDSLEEEKRRGLSINLGYAYLHADLMLIRLLALSMSPAIAVLSTL